MNDVPPRLLRETLQEQPTQASSSVCLDAETMAAWLDGTLSRRERAIAESHASICPRCQATLAAISKTAGPSVTRKWWQTQTVRWLVPIAVTSAAALVLWVKTPSQRRPFEVPRAEQFGASVDTPASAAQTSAAPPATESAPRPRAARGPNQREASKDAKALAAREDANLKAPAAAPALERDAAPAASASAPAPLRADVPAAAGSAREESAFAPARQAAKALAAPLGIVSPDRNIRWQILPGGGVERSIDGGASWQMQLTGAAVTLTGGAAPTPTICWLVGPGGIVVVSTDGRTWQRVAFPESVDLVAIRASDGTNATVTASDGRTFTTTDGGRTWRLP
jgi:hypothetical protein